MATTFVDTAHFVALLDPRDTLHAQAMALTKRLAKRSAELVTSDAVLVEVGNYFARGPLRSRAMEWIVAVRAAPGWRIEAVTRPLLLRGEALYRAHADESWSVTDCVSMELMRDQRIRDIATTDHGFAQAGFRVLLSVPGRS